MSWFSRLVFDSPIIASSFAAKLLQQRHLLWNFVVRDLKSRYVGSLMGLLWSVVHPLVLLISYTFVFSVIFKVRSPLANSDNFAVFLFAGILPWLYFQETLQRSVTSVVDHSNLIRKTVFPSEILPVTVALSNLVTHLVGFVILAVVLLWSGLITWTVVWVPIYLVLLVVLATGLAWLLAGLQVFLRDTSQVLSVSLILWFWFTPIFYRVEDVPRFKVWLLLNPMTYVVEGYRAVLLEGRFPGWTSLAILAAFAFVAFVVGGVFFRSTKREFVDVI